MTFLRSFAILSVGIGAGLLLGIRLQQERTRELAAKAAKWDEMDQALSHIQPLSVEEQAESVLIDKAYEEYQERRNNG
jgi:hypothetical protein